MYCSHNDYTGACCAPGYLLQQHAGSLGGYLSHLALLPDVNAGVFVAVNKSPDNRLRDVVVMHVLDLLLGRYVNGSTCRHDLSD